MLSIGCKAPRNQAKFAENPLLFLVHPFILLVIGRASNPPLPLLFHSSLVELSGLSPSNSALSVR